MQIYTLRFTQYIKLMREVCYLLMVLMIFGCSNMSRWKLSLKKST